MIDMIKIDTHLNRHSRSLIWLNCIVPKPHIVLLKRKYTFFGKVDKYNYRIKWNEMKVFIYRGLLHYLGNLFSWRPSFT